MEPVDIEGAITPLCPKESSPDASLTSDVIFDETQIISSSPIKKVTPKRVKKTEVTETPTKKRVRKSLNYNELVRYEILNKSLKENAFGRSIISFYEKAGYLDRNNRNKLASVIISLELEDNLDKRISSERFLELREAIIKIFPTETKETWYTPYQNVANERKINARGKLLDLYHNNRKNLIKSGLIAKRGYTENFSTLKPDETADESVADKLDWLSKSGVPYEKAYLYWKETVEVRNKQFQGHNLEIYQICRGIYECLSMQNVQNTTNRNGDIVSRKSIPEKNS
ncbi:hypothetical protein JTE90_023032 [Oedothorax gibbosus]|uniref:Uncharacterized protein n=1 Tax=Oedothorax gibbosus TaxID=931172 RepID=A0AAV6V062_9ARAC|nr:hypothetical protein JTE90_023032 [Oedothorax gibbosus]